MEKVGIYKITNIINGKCYIGQTKGSLDSRLKEHFVKAKNNDVTYSRLHILMNELGEKYFQIELLEVCDDDVANEKEQFYIEKFNSINPEHGYNTRNPSFKTRNIKIDDDFEKLVIDLYINKKLPVGRISKQVHKDHRVIKKILEKHNLNLSGGDATRKTYAFPLTMIDPKTLEEIRSFENQYEAAKYVIDNGINISSYDNVLKNIQMAARQKETREFSYAYGFFWRKDGPSIFEQRKNNSN